MSKLGVGVGEEFPVEEPHEASDRGDDRHRECEEWRARARAFKDDVRRAAHRHFGDRRWGRYSHFWPQAIAVVAMAVIVLALLPHLLLPTGIVVLLVLYAAWRGHFDHDHFDAHPDARV